MLLEVLCVVLVILVSHVIFKKIFGDSDKIVDDSYSNGTASNKSGAGSDSDSGSDSESSGSESDESDKEKPRMTILFGSQSGTAEGFAGEIEEEASSKGIDIIRLHVLPTLYCIEFNKSHVVYLICSYTHISLFACMCIAHIVSCKSCRFSC